MKQTTRSTFFASHAAFSSARLLLPLLLVAASLACVPASTGAQTLAELRAARKAAFDQQALQLLRQMSEAYANLTVLDQQTEFYSLQTPILPKREEEKKISKEEDKTQSGDLTTVRSAVAAGGELPHAPVDKPMGRTVRLIVVGPNRMRLDISEEGDENTPAKNATTICDGKTLWVYNADKNWYTQTKAPRKLVDFQKVTNLGNTTLELLMMIGLNPFTDVETQFDAVKYEGTANVRGIATDVVMLRAVSERQTQEVRFFINRDNLLLQRIMIESRPIVQDMAPPKHDILEDLIPRPVVPVTQNPSDPKLEVAPGFEDPHPLAPPGAPMFVRITCDNIFTLSPRLEPDTFVFKPPQGAALYQDVNGRGDFSKMSTPLSVQELVKQELRKQGQANKSAKKSKPVRVKL